MVLSALTTILLAVLGFPFYVVIRKPEKYHAIVRLVQFACLILLAIGAGFSFGIMYGQKHHSEPELANLATAVLWIILFIMLAYWGALETVRRYLHD